jgi:hypothetical protein
MPTRSLAAALAATPNAPDVVVMRLQGELGNQLFQFAVGTAVARRLECPLRFDLDKFEPTLAHCIGDAFVMADDVDLLRCAELRDTALQQWLRSLQLRAWLPYRRARHRPERHLQHNDAFTLEPRMDELGAPCFLRGYFQQLDLFDEVLDDVLARLARELGLPARSDDGAGPGSGADPGRAQAPTVGVHFRRGDYLPRGWELPLDYYEAALAVVDDQLVSPQLVVFADDAVFAQLLVEHLRAQGRTATLAGASDAHPHPAVDALIQLASCDHRILSNSTFAWWAGALGDHLATVRAGPEPVEGRLTILPDRWRRERPPPNLVRPGWRSLPSWP